jgi:pyruvate kinase
VNAEAHHVEVPPLPLTKIVATLGPASSSAETIGRLIECGVSVFRFNFSHGTLEEHAGRLAIVREAAVRLGQPTGVLGDLQGPKVRIGEVVAEGVDVATGAKVVIQREPIVARPPATGQAARFSTTYENLVDDVEPGQRVLVDDGAVRMLIIEKDENAIDCVVTYGGSITSHKGVNLPESELEVSSITDRDWRCVDWAIEHDLDFLAISFIRRAEDIRQLAEGVKQRSIERGCERFRMPIIAKIETPAAVARIESIVDAADAIMIARGDLGVEMDLADVPVIQKRLIAKAQDYGKPCIVATQMLESMIDRPAPTRAEASDVAGAIFEQSDAVMLSGETAIGRFPVMAVEQMRRIAERTEAHLRTLPAEPSPPIKLRESRYLTAALAHGVWTIAQDIDAKCIGVWSQTGGGARYLSQNNFRIPIVAATSDERAARQMQLLRGVRPVHMDLPPGVGTFTRRIDAWIRASGLAKMGDACVLVAHEPLEQAGRTNSLAIHFLGDPDSGFAHHGK